MNAYQILLFVHVLGAVGVFAAISMEAVALGMLRRADSAADARLSLAVLALPSRLGPVAMGATLVSGLGMMAMVWGRRPWMVAAVVALVGMAALGARVSGRRLRSLRAALASGTGSPQLPDAFRSLQSDDALAASLRLRTALGIAILALMSFRPDVAGSSLTLAVGVLGGLLARRVPLAIHRPRPAEASAQMIER